MIYNQFNCFFVQHTTRSRATWKIICLAGKSVTGMSDMSNTCSTHRATSRPNPEATLSLTTRCDYRLSWPKKVYSKNKVHGRQNHLGEYSSQFDFHVRQSKNAEKSFFFARRRRGGDMHLDMHFPHTGIALIHLELTLSPYIWHSAVIEWPTLITAKQTQPVVQMHVSQDSGTPAGSVFVIVFVSFALFGSWWKAEWMNGGKCSTSLCLDARCSFQFETVY